MPGGWFTAISRLSREIANSNAPILYSLSDNGPESNPEADQEPLSQFR
jgi:hypothetical protein